jgi:hypothetical protein
MEDTSSQSKVKSRQLRVKSSARRRTEEDRGGRGLIEE